LVEVGKTPLVKVDGIYAKMECTNPMGSIKDRLAKYVIEESERRGLLKPGMEIVEASSGNTGIALAYFAREKGYPITVIMPENMSEERKNVIRVLGANMVLCPPGDFAEAAVIRDEMVAKDPNRFNPDQFSNPLNVECHYRTTAQEILDQMAPHAERIDAFVAGVGTGGTLIGVGSRLREHNPDVHLVAVEPSESPVMSGGEKGMHGIQGIGDGFIPHIATDGAGGLNPLVDEVGTVSTQEAIDAAQYLADDRGLCVGISSGANYLVARRVAEARGTTVTVFPDGMSKYRSMGLHPRGKCQFDRQCKCPIKEVCGETGAGEACELVDTDCGEL
jgi:cysteine synthase A